MGLSGGGKNSKREWQKEKYGSGRGKVKENTRMCNTECHQPFFPENGFRNR